MEKVSKSGYKFLKIIFPHLVILLGISCFVYLFIFQAMMFTSNNGEFGYPDQGIYDWASILPILGVWFGIFVVLFELPLIIYQWVKHKVDAIKHHES